MIEKSQATIGANYSYPKPSAAAEELYLHIAESLLNGHLSWNIYGQLFLSGDENLELMRTSAESCFGTFRWAMYESIVLTICRLTDPANQNGFENLSILRLRELLQKANSVEASELDSIRAAEIDSVWKANFHRFKPLRDQRNKQIAHSDLLSAKQPPCTRDEIDDAFKGVIAVMKVIYPFFVTRPPDWDRPYQRGSGTDLLKILARWKKSIGLKTQ